MSVMRAFRCLRVLFAALQCVTACVAGGPLRAVLCDDDNSCVAGGPLCAVLSVWCVSLVGSNLPGTGSRGQSPRGD